MGPHGEIGHAQTRRPQVPQSFFPSHRGVCSFAGGAAGAGSAMPRCHFAGWMCWSPAGFSHAMGSVHAQQWEKLDYDLQTGDGLNASTSISRLNIICPLWSDNQIKPTFLLLLLPVLLSASLHLNSEILVLWQMKQLSSIHSLLCGRRCWLIQYLKSHQILTLQDPKCSPGYIHVLFAVPFLVIWFLS